MIICQNGADMILELFLLAYCIALFIETRYVILLGAGGIGVVLHLQAY